MFALRVSNRLLQTNIAYETPKAFAAIEAQALLSYKASRYLPVHINQTSNQRYQISLKLGYGAYSTVWLCRDLMEKLYKVLKVDTLDKDGDREMRVQNHLKEFKSSHDGRYCDGKQLRTGDVAWIAKYLLLGLDYLRSCGVVHTDIKLDNIINTLPVDEQRILDNCVQAENSQPGARNTEDDYRTIYTSRIIEHGNILTFPILSDFGSAAINQYDQHRLIQALPYRAPEVILRLPWDLSADMWNFGVIIWELVLGGKLFSYDTEKDCLAKMISILGPPPVQLLERSPIKAEYFSMSNNRRGSKIEAILLEEEIEGDNAKQFLDFVRSAMKWDPKERKTAAQLLSHPWLDSYSSDT